MGNTSTAHSWTTKEHDTGKVQKIHNARDITAGVSEKPESMPRIAGSAPDSWLLLNSMTLSMARFFTQETASGPVRLHLLPHAPRTFRMATNAHSKANSTINEASRNIQCLLQDVESSTSNYSCSCTRVLFMSRDDSPEADDLQLAKAAAGGPPRLGEGSRNAPI